jgi:hypothetical protein
MEHSAPTYQFDEEAAEARSRDFSKIVAGVGLEDIAKSFGFNC